MKKFICNDVRSYLKSDHIKKISNHFIIFAILLSISVLVLPMQESFAQTVQWQDGGGGIAGGADFNDENILAANPGIKIFVEDTTVGSGFVGNGGPPDQITVTLTSNAETIQITLQESAGDAGQFESRVAFLYEDFRFDLSDEVVVTIVDPAANNFPGIPEQLDSRNCCTFPGNPFNPLLPQPNGVKVTSDTLGAGGVPFPAPANGIGLLLTETGPNTGVFTQTITFSTTVNDEDNGILQVSPGDMIHFFDNTVFAEQLGVINPSTPGVAGLIIDTTTPCTGGTPCQVSAIYDNGGGPIQDDLDVTDGNPGGRGGGGPAKIGLVVDSVSATPSGGGGNNSDPPTLGLSPNNEKLVDYGFFHNSDKYEITDTFWTPFEKVQINVGEPQSFGMKGTGTYPITRVEFGLVPEVGMMHKAEVLVEVWVNDGAPKVVIKQGENIIDKSMFSPEVDIRDEDCFEGSGKKDCLFVGFKNVVFREEPFFEVVALNIVDEKGRTSVVYLNDGFDIVGESMNPPKTDFTVSDKKGVGVIGLTQINKWNNIWKDENGIEYFKNTFGTYIIQTPIKLDIQDDESWNVMNRMNNNFDKILEYEQMRAMKKFDSNKIISELPDSFAYEVPNYQNRFNDDVFVKYFEMQGELAKQYWNNEKIQGKLRTAVPTWSDQN